MGVHRGLLLAILVGVPGAPVIAQSLLAEAEVIPAEFGQAAQRIEVRDLNGDGARDMVLVRAGAEGRVIELWLRNDASAAAFQSGPPLGAFDTLIDAVVFDFDLDGDNDIVVATGASATSAGGLSLLSNDGGATFVPQFTRGSLQPLVGVTGLKVQDVQTPGGLRFGVAASTSEGQVQLFAVLPGSGLQPAQTLSHPGGVATSLSVPFLLDGGSAILTLGAPPQRLWVWNGTAYAARAVIGIDRQVTRATTVTVDGNDALDLVTADSSGRVEVWTGSASAANQPADRFDLVQSLEDAGSPVVALDTSNVDAGKLDVLVARQQPSPADTTRLHRIDIATGSIAPAVLIPAGGAGIGVERRSPDTVFLGGAEAPLRAFVRAGAAPAGTLGFSRSGYYAVEGFATYVPLSTSVALPQSATIGLATSRGNAATFALAGRRTHDVRLPTSFTVVPGQFNLDLIDPQVPGIGLREPLRSTMTVFARVPGGPAAQFCTVECLLLGCIGEIQSKGGGGSGGIGLPAEVALLRAFRDGVLQASPKGREYVAGYDEYERELYLVSFTSPTFLLTLRDAKDAWMPAIDSLVNGNGSAPITGAMLDRMDAVFAHFRSNSSSGLRQMIERRYLELNPRQFANQPIGAMRTHWEDVLRTEDVFGSGFEAPPPMR